MANDDKQTGSNLASGGVILAALVATGAYVFHREAPLLDSRPAVSEAGIPEPAAARQQKIDARLWQDPFAAVAKSRDKLGKDRRRTRYAVLAGLERRKFAPSDARHIGYFLWPDETRPRAYLQQSATATLQLATSQRTVVPYEWFEKVQLRRVPYQGQNLPGKEFLCFG